MVEYRKLQNNEIRVLKLLTEEDDPRFGSGPIRCELEYVDLADPTPLIKTDNHRFTKGFTGSWPTPIVEDIELQPRIRHRADSNLLWPTYSTDGIKKGLSAKFSSLRTSKTSDIKSGSATSDSSRNVHEFNHEDANLPWRYSWGDYVALSYVWGDQSPESARDIFVNGSPLSVTQNLEAALQQLRKHYRIKQGFRIWADAVCINQSDLEERSSQVAMMKKIYEAAWHVVVWLGPKAQNSDLAMIAIRYFSLRSRNFADPLDGVYKHVDKVIFKIGKYGWRHAMSFPRMRPSVLRAIYHLLSRPYFRRLWILQEVALGARNGPVLCGDRCVQVDDLYFALKAVQSNGADFGKQIIAAINWWNGMRRAWYLTRGDTYSTSEKLWERPISIIESQNTPQSSRSVAHEGLFGALLLGREARAKDERDRVYGILGLHHLAKAVRMTPDYSLTAIQTFELFSRHLYASGDLNGLRLIASAIPCIGTRYFKVSRLSRPKTPRFVSRHRIVNPGCIHSLPSWVICWSCLPNPAVNLPRHSCLPAKYRIATPIFQEHKFMNIQGIIFDTICNLSSFHAVESDDSYPLNTQTVQSIYGDHTATDEAFWRTIVGNRTRSGNQAPSGYRFVLQASLWEEPVVQMSCRKFFLLSDFYTRNKRMCLFDRTLSDLVRGPKTPDGRRTKDREGRYEILPPEVKRERQEAVMWAMHVLAWRRLIVTRDGYLGLAPAASKAGDVVAVVPGCDVPLVLRREGERFRVLGEGYVHGIMSGELQEMLEKGTRKMVDITLC